MLTQLIVGLDHVQVCAPRAQEDAAKHFYGTVLGLQELPKPGALQGRGGAWYACGNAMLHLGVEDDFHPAGKAHPGLLVNDVDEVARRLHSAGCEPIPGIPIPGYRRIETRDPFGNRLEFLQRV
jgi:catechol 2,3-dioxygenase-like lactoylglutathione lyase family enzyme